MFISVNNNDEEETPTKDSKDSEDVPPDDLPPKPLFRGFEMMPKVLCERFDITPYIAKQNNMKKPVIMRGSYENGDLEKFLKQCTVTVVREDLLKLKQCYKKTNNINRKSILSTSRTEKMCKICKKTYTSEKKHRNHVQSKHMIEYKETKPRKRVSFSDQVIVHEFKEYHRCRKCPKIYEDYNSLKQHMKQMHKKRKCYICFYCNKGFAERMIFKMHIKMHCSMCGKFFLSKKLYSDHKRTVCRVIKKYECKTCKEVYFSYLSLKDHSYEHEGVLFVCDICKERCKTKCTLLHHIQYLHCKRRPKNLYDTIHDKAGVTYECNSCDHCSSNKQTMEDHTVLLPDLKNSKTTGYKDYFFCDQCSKQFDNETEMLRHKWSHFLNTNNKTEDKIQPSDTYKTDNKIEGSDNNKTGNEVKCDINSMQVKKKYKIGEELPPLLKPKIVLDKLKLDKKEEANADVVCNNIVTTDISDPLITKSTENTENTEHINKIPLLDKGQIESNPVKVPRKKTLLSNHLCKLCGKYFSTKYCLRRHVEKTHMEIDSTGEDQNLQCPVCEETFVWKSLLLSHKCIRMHNPDIPFQDARPDILFDNQHLYMMNGSAHGMSNVNMVPVTYEVPTPEVELTEYNNVDLLVNDAGAVKLVPSRAKTTSNGYRIVIQEVPIEF
ncbi:zinc finger protein 546-like [Aricia agestis]|uniref:zinc finger protein 546-like n=1 Tax=Aricia agestis TaxID=91739 RepID=UPI001C20C192|nr:zinc finger protein 546-like [Aricia agestis]